MKWRQSLTDAAAQAGLQTALARQGLAVMPIDGRGGR